MRGVVFPVDAFKLSVYFPRKSLLLCFDQNFDARFVDVVPSTPAVENPDHCFNIVDDFMGWQELFEHRSNEGGAPHTATDQNSESKLTRAIFVEMKSNIVPSCSCSILGCTRNSDFKFTR